MHCWPTTAAARDQSVIEGGVMIAFDCQHVFKVINTEIFYLFSHCVF